MLAAIEAIQEGKPAGPPPLKEIAAKFATSYQKVYASLSIMEGRISAVNSAFYQDAVGEEEGDFIFCCIGWRMFNKK